MSDSITNKDKLNLEEELEKKLRSIKLKQDEEEASKLAQNYGLPFSPLKTVPVDPEALGLIAEETARNSQLAIITKTGKTLAIAILDPQNASTKEVIENLKKSGYTLNIIMTTAEALQNIWKRYTSLPNKTPTYEIGSVEISQENLDKISSQIKDVSDLKSHLNNASVTELLETILAGALKVKASDVHIEPESSQARLRYRIDGVLNDVSEIDNTLYNRLLSRVKVLSKMRLNVHKTAQDGRFTIKQQSIDIEVRVSVLPSEFGEALVLRILDPRVIKAELEALGMRPDLLDLIKQQLKRSTGAILTTGPTGSGKTTTLYAFIQYLNTTDTKIVTIEDPIEYHISGASQTQVDPAKGYTFANGLKAIVRQDPDVILVGEIRDKETAEIALHAALTGHLVFSTIHTNNAAGTIPRLIDLGINPPVIAPAINMAMGQRLVRRLCQDCKIKKKIDEETLKKIKASLDPIKDRVKFPKIDSSTEIFEAGKCDKCGNSGYAGRIGVYEAFLISKEMEKLILKSPAASEMEELAVKDGMITMLQDAYLKLLEGITSLSEIERII